MESEHEIDSRGQHPLVQSLPAGIGMGLAVVPAFLHRFHSQAKFLRHGNGQRINAGRVAGHDDGLRRQCG
ncbi:hypothetical protein LP420_20375 [Massilia sp. B-10]|nr:hypothetical protein LP420_20375 [Massilia sp. B-10]